MDGADSAACLTADAQAVQMGTAFVACPETSADASFREALLMQGKEKVLATFTFGTSAA